MWIKSLALYLVIIFTLAIGLYLFLLSYSRANYSDQKKELLLTSPSKFKINTENPCTHSIYGDPTGVEEDYIKVNLYCSNTDSSTNTLALKGISPDNYLGALYLLASVNLFEAGIIPQRIDKLGNLVSENNDWRCFAGIDQEIKNFETKLKPKDTITCFYKFSESDIRRHYEAH